MMLYVYQVSATEYGAGIGQEACKDLGKIVEQWPMNTPSEAQFIAKRGSAFNGVSSKVTRIAEAARDLMNADPTFVLAMDRRSLCERIAVAVLARIKRVKA